ncbi:MAG: nucleotidyltransferase domain-containing protein [Candidatus Eisenbacteria sp.]|nr:nucleotidyltransferase domain-containing protein [Candidatus Eisenbacteria bacterium]
MDQNEITKRLGLDPEKLRAFCRRWKVAELAVFGSLLRDDFGPGSDADLLVTFDEHADWSAWDFALMREELVELLDRDVDLVERPVIQQSRNYIRKAAILADLEVIYAAR